MYVTRLTVHDNLRTTSGRTLSGATLLPTSTVRGFAACVLADDAVIFCCRASSYIVSVGWTYQRFLSYLCDIISRIRSSSFTLNSGANWLS